MSRADKTLTKINYTITMDAKNQRIESLEVVTLCATRTDKGPANKKLGFTGRHIAFRALYRFSQRNSVEPIRVPQRAARLLN